MRNKDMLLRTSTALLLILLTAALPFLTAFWQDMTTLGTPAVGDNQTVELDFSKGTPGLALLALMDQANESRWQVIAPAAASMTMEAAQEAAGKALEPYREAGLIPGGLSFEVRTAETRVVSIPAGLAGVVWIFAFTAEENDGILYEVNLAMDDASGRILNFGYGCEDRISERGMEEKLHTFASVYFGQLGIGDHEDAEVDDLENTYIGDTAIAQRYRFRDETYGPCGVDLYLYQHGFFTDFNN